MTTELVQAAINKAGLSNSFKIVTLDEFAAELDRIDAYKALTNDCFHRFLQSIIQINIIPATWQKLADLGWSDDEIAGLVDADLITEAPTTLVAAINLGAMAIQEYNEFSSYPNQEVKIFHYTKRANELIVWLRGRITLPKVDKDAFSLDEKK